MYIYVRAGRLDRVSALITDRAWTLTGLWPGFARRDPISLLARCLPGLARFHMLSLAPSTKSLVVSSTTQLIGWFTAAVCCCLLLSCRCPLLSGAAVWRRA